MASIVLIHYNKRRVKCYRMRTYIENFMRYRHLLYELVISELKIKYRRSFFGILWSVLQPLMMMVILTVVFASMFKSNIEHFAVYVLTGRIIWDLYSQTTLFAMNSLIDNASLIKKVYLPKYIFPLAKSVTALVNTLFSLFALFLVILFTGVKLNLYSLLFPLPLLYMFIFATGIGLIVSTYTVFFRDIKYLYEVFLAAWIYLTPIFYPITVLPDKVRFIVELNPIYYFLDMFRIILINGQAPSLVSNLICLSISVITLLIGFICFVKKQDRFVLYI